MSIRHRALVAALVAAALLPATRDAWAQQDPLKLLVDQGNYWQDHQRGDLAREAWMKILAVAPNNPDALYGMGIVEADQRHNDLAAGYLRKLKQVAPGYAGVATLAGRLGQQAPQDTRLTEARRLAAAGKPDAAVARYREIMAAGQTPSVDVSLEYYQTLGGTSQGWDEARRGLERLAHDNPDNHKVALALAKHLTYREATRVDGIRQLAALSNSADVATDARASWRQALIWLGARPADTGLYNAYLQAVPDDAAIKARLDALNQQEQTARAQGAAGVAASARGKAVASGYDALQGGDLDLATQRFQAILAANPNDTDALGGMGVLRLKQEKFSDARDLLERASRGPNPGRWRSALNSATYWSLVEDASKARQGGDGAAARRLLERAIKIDPNEPTAENALGDVFSAGGDAKAAEAAYRMVLRRQADNPDAIRGLVGALAAQNKSEEALQFANQLTAQQRERIGGLGTLRAQQQQVQGRKLEESGDLAGARTALENALLNDPDSPWIRLDLARVYMKQGFLTNARSVMDGLLVSHPDLPDALYASALLYGELGDWNRSLQTLERIPPASRSRDMLALQRRMWVHATTDRASALARHGQMAQAHALLMQAEPVAGSDPELLGAVASGYADTGDNNRALTLTRQMLTQTVNPDVGLRIQYAGILLKTNQDAELSSVLRQIQSTQMTPPQHADFDKLQLAYALRQADTLRQQGDLVNAYNVLAPALAVRPNDPDLQAALARMYASAGEYSEALRLYDTAHAAKPDDLDLTLAATGTAVSAKNYDFAETAIGSALQQAPNNPRVLAEAGRVYRAQGKNSKAADYFRQSLAAEKMPAGGPNGPLDMRLVDGSGPQPPGQVSPNRLPSNPFIGKTVVNPPTQQPTYSQQTMPYLPPNQPPAQGVPYTQQAPRQGMPPPYQTVAPGNAPAYAPAYAPSGAPPAYPSNPAPAYQPYPGQSANQPSSYEPMPGGEPVRQAAQPNPYESAGDGYESGVSQSGYQQAQYQPQYQQPQYQQAQYQQAQYQPPYQQQQYQQPQYQQPQYQQPAYQPPPQPVYQQPQYQPPAYPPQYQQPAYQPRPYQAQYQQPVYQQPQQPVYQQPAYQQPAYQPPAYQQNGYPPPSYQQGGNYAPLPAPLPYDARNDQGYAPDDGSYGATSQPCRRTVVNCKPATTRKRVVTRRAPPRQMQAAAPAYQAYPPYPYQPQYAQAPVPYQPRFTPQTGPGGATGLPAASWSGSPAPAAANQPLSVQDELDQINQEHASTVSGGVVFRNRAGEDGLSGLNDIETPIEGRIGMGDGHLVIRATPVTLDGGTPDPGYATSSRFGSGPVAAFNQSLTNGTAVKDQTASGVGLALGYETKQLKLDAGVTPLGFPQSNVVGGINYRAGLTDQTSIAIDVSRRAVTDSVLSYAGARDNRTGVAWGGVTASGVRTDLTWDDGTNGLYGYGSFQYLMGNNVESNTRGEGGGGVYTRVIKDANQTVTAGVNLDVLGYNKNLSYFTYGQGGYFSPQQYLQLSVPVQWDVKSGKLAYQLKGSLGVQHFREDDSPYFPTSASLQSAANAAQSAAAAANLATTTSAVYPGQSKTGLAYNLQGVAEYQLSPQIFVGGIVGLGNAHDYKEYFGSVYLRYAFQKMNIGPSNSTLAPLHSPFLASPN